MSEVLSRKANLSVRQGEKIAARLFKLESERTYFCSLVAHACESDEHRTKSIVQSLALLRDAEKSHVVDVDTFKKISDWRYYVLLTSVSLKNTQPDLHALAKKIGWTHGEIVDAIEFLVRLGFLEWQGATLVVSTSKTQTQTEVPSLAIRSFQKGLLQRAGEQIERQEVSERDFSARILSIDANDLPAIKERIRDFWNRLVLESSNKPSARKVYALSVELFGLLDE